MRRLYTLALYLLLPLVMLRLLGRSRAEPAYRRRWAERLGRFPHRVDRETIWVHAVSVGEAVAAFPLVSWLRERHPDLPVVLTTTTPTGSERVIQHFADAVLHGYLPYDLPGAVARFLDRTRPRIAIIMETEIWPNLYAACAARGIPVVIANARLSERSAAGYRRLAPLVRATLQGVAAIAAQGEDDAGRLRALGAPGDRIRVTGNIKFDIALPARLNEEAVVLRRAWGAQRPVWVAASTHEGEEAQVLDAFRQARRALGDLLLVLVPRRPERFDRVAALCAAQGWQVVRRTQRRPCDAQTGVFLGDTMGELPLFYAAADCAFVGGSLVPVGGHNPLEAAALHRPVVFGPHMFNFTDISRWLLTAGGAVQVRDAAGLADAVVRIMRDPRVRSGMGGRAAAVVERNRGALDRLVAMIEEEITGDR